jgi:hypothetical protein
LASFAKESFGLPVYSKKKNTHTPTHIIYIYIYIYSVKNRLLSFNMIRTAENYSMKHAVEMGVAAMIYTGCIKKSFTTSKAYINLFSGHVQCFELS